MRMIYYIIIFIMYMDCFIIGKKLIDDSPISLPNAVEIKKTRQFPDQVRGEKGGGEKGGLQKGGGEKGGRTGRRGKGLGFGFGGLGKGGKGHCVKVRDFSFTVSSRAGVGGFNFELKGDATGGADKAKYLDILSNATRAHFKFNGQRTCLSISTLKLVMGEPVIGPPLLSTQQSQPAQQTQSSIAYNFRIIGEFKECGYINKRKRLSSGISRRGESFGEHIGNYNFATTEVEIIEAPLVSRLRLCLGRPRSNYLQNK